MPALPSVGRCRTCGAETSTDGSCPACMLDRGLMREESSGPASFEIKAFGDYELLEEIARGGMGVVYRARQKSLNRIVAIKMVLAGKLAKPSELQRFRAEAETAARLQHPNIVAIHEVGEFEGQPFFSMDYVEGKSLAELAHNEPMPAKRAAAYLKTIAEAVEYAHSKGVLHRDLKPSNILIDQNDQPRITDFGLAKRLEDSALSTLHSSLTITGQVLGSPNFMPPEQAAGKHRELTPASDVYSLGALLYHLLAGRPPFLAENIPATLRLVAETDPVPPRLLAPCMPRDLETICLKCLEKEPSRRYSTAQALAEDLKRFLRDEPILARPVGSIEKVYRWCLCNRPLALAGTAACVLLVTIVIGSPIALIRINRERERAQQNAINEQLQRRQAEEARQNETQLRQKAQAQELETRRYAYASDMTLVWEALEVNALARARELLDRYRPQPGANTNEDIRGWEWRYFWQFCKEDDAVPLCKLNQAASISFSRDGALLAVGTDAGEMTVWDMATRQLVFRETSGGAFRRKVAFSPASGLMAYNDAQSGFVLWDSDTRRQIRRLDTGGHVRDLEFCNDGRLFTATTRLRDGVTLWDTETGVAITNFPAAISEFELGNTFSIAPDGRTFAQVVENRNVRVVRVESRDEWVFPATDESIICLAFSMDGGTLAIGSGFTEGAIQLWNITDRKLMSSLEGHTAYPRSLRFLRDGKTLASAAEDHTIRLWDLEKRRMSQSLRGHVASATYIDVSPDGRWVASGGVDGSVFLWDTTAPNLHPPPYRTLSSGPVQSFMFSPDNRYIGAVQDGSLKIFDAVTLQPAGPTFLATNINGFGFSPDMRLIVTSDIGGHLTAWDCESGRMRTNFVAHQGGAWLFQNPFLPGSQRLLSLGPALEVKEWDVRSWREIRRWQISPEATYDFTCTFSPTEDLVVIGGGRVIEVVNVDDPTIRRRFASQQQLGLSRLAISSDGRTLATLGGDGTMGLWDLASEKEMAQLRPGKNESSLNSVAFFPDGGRVAAGSDGRQAIIVCDLHSGQTVATLDGKRSTFTRVAISPDGQAIGAQNLDGILHVWRAPPSGNDDPRTISDLFALISLRVKQNKLADAQTLCDELVSRAPESDATWDALTEMLGQTGDWNETILKWLRLTESKPETATLCRRRGEILGRSRHWDASIKALTRAIELKSDEHEFWHLLAPILVESGHHELYRQHCRDSLEKFATTMEPSVAERISKDCLILPNSGANLETISTMTDLAANASSTHWALPYFQFCKGFAEYRLGHFRSATEWMQKTLAVQGDWTGKVEAYLVLAMSKFQLGKKDEAQRALTQALAIQEAHEPKPENSDLGIYWTDWLIVHALMRETHTLIEGVSSNPKDR